MRKVLHVRMVEPPKKEQLELWPEKAKYIAKVQCERCKGWGRISVIISREYQRIECRKCAGKGYIEEEVGNNVYTQYLVNSLPKDAVHSVWARGFLG